MCIFVVNAEIKNNFLKNKDAIYKIAYCTQHLRLEPIDSLMIEKPKCLELLRISWCDKTLAKLWQKRGI